MIAQAEKEQRGAGHALTSPSFCCRAPDWLLQSSPTQVHRCRPTALVILQPHPVVALAQGDVRTVGSRLVLPLVNEQRVAHPQTHAVIGEDGKAVGLGLEPHIALPASGEVVRRDAGAGEGGAPVEIYRKFLADKPRGLMVCLPDFEMALLSHRQSDGQS